MEDHAQLADDDGIADGATDARDGRCRGERGTSFVLAMVILFLTTGMAAIWLARDVNGRVSDRSALQSIAFQAARTGAQQLDVAAVRGGGAVTIDADRATASAQATASRLADSYEIGVVVIEQGYGADAATWTVTVGLLVDDVDAADAERFGAVVTGVAHAEVGG